MGSQSQNAGPSNSTTHTLSSPLFFLLFSDLTTYLDKFKLQWPILIGKASTLNCPSKGRTRKKPNVENFSNNLIPIAMDTFHWLRPTRVCVMSYKATNFLTVNRL